MRPAKTTEGKPIRWIAVVFAPHHTPLTCGHYASEAWARLCGSDGLALSYRAWYRKQGYYCKRIKA